MTWQYLQLVNRQLRTLGPIINGLQSTGVYFTSPAPVASAPTLPGRLVKGLRAEAPAMVGEFVSPDGARYAMVVNLSLQRSAKVGLELQEGYRRATVISAEDGSEFEMQTGSALWLAAGQGTLLRLR